VPLDADSRARLRRASEVSTFQSCSEASLVNGPSGYVFFVQGTRARARARVRRGDIILNVE